MKKLTFNFFKKIFVIESSVCPKSKLNVVYIYHMCKNALLFFTAICSYVEE